MIKSIPRGKVAAYGQIAALAGDARQARQVAWILHSTPGREGLPWHRVINSRGRISLPPSRGGREQAGRLRAEGVPVGSGGTIEVREFGWNPRSRKTAVLEKMDLTRLL